jgi:hypothetical protein
MSKQTTTDIIEQQKKKVDQVLEKNSATQRRVDAASGTQLRDLLDQMTIRFRLQPVNNLPNRI